MKYIIVKVLGLNYKKSIFRVFWEISNLFMKGGKNEIGKVGYNVFRVIINIRRSWGNIYKFFKDRKWIKDFVFILNFNKL